MPRRLVALLGVALLATILPACGDDSPSSSDVPSGAVAKVGDAEISREELDGQVDALARAQRGAGAPTKADGGPDAGSADDQAAKQLRKQLEAQALSMLLMREALEQEAAERGIEVTDAEVRQRWETASKGQFKTKKALRRFLGGQTEKDLLAQLRLQVLTDRILEHVRENAEDNPDEAVKKHQEQFTQRWQDRTACAEGYTATACSDDSK